MGYSEKKNGYVNHYDEKDNSGCFLTTACVEYKGLSDNCYELEVLRNFRDNYMMSFDQGKKDIEKYYEIAPTIVKNINEDNNKDYI